MLGNGRLEALCFDGEKRLAHIRGKLRKKVWINQGDIILLSLRDYQDEKGDVILKYSADEARSLKAYGELPESAKINETDTYVVLLDDTFEKNVLLIAISATAVTATRVLTTTSSSTKIAKVPTRRTSTLTRSERSHPSNLDTGGAIFLTTRIWLWYRQKDGSPSLLDRGLSFHNEQRRS